MANKVRDGKKAYQTMLKKYGADHFVKAGRKGGKRRKIVTGFGDELPGSDGLTGPQRAKKFAKDKAQMKEVLNARWHKDKEKD